MLKLLSSISILETLENFLFSPHIKGPLQHGESPLLQLQKHLEQPVTNQFIFSFLRRTEPLRWPEPYSIAAGENTSRQTMKKRRETLSSGKPLSIKFTNLNISLFIPRAYFLLVCFLIKVVLRWNLNFIPLFTWYWILPFNLYRVLIVFKANVIKSKLYRYNGYLFLFVSLISLLGHDRLAPMSPSNGYPQHERQIRIIINGAWMYKT